jgi:hypothetical protein
MAANPNYTLSIVEGKDSSYTFAAATALYLRVLKNSSGKAAIAGATDKSTGVCFGNEVEEADGLGTVRYHHMVGEQIMIASEAIDIGDPVFAAASGKVAATGTICEGIAKTATTGDDQQIVVVPIGAAEYAAKVTVSAGQAAANSGNGQVDLTLPFPFADAAVVVNLLTVTTGRVKSTYDVTGTASTLSVKGVAAGTQVDEGDVIYVHAKRVS